MGRKRDSVPGVRGVSGFHSRQRERGFGCTTVLFVSIPLSGRRCIGHLGAVRVWHALGSSKAGVALRGAKRSRDERERQDGRNQDPQRAVEVPKHDGLTLPARPARVKLSASEGRSQYPCESSSTLTFPANER
jgi:hypothetical protein